MKIRLAILFSFVLIFSMVGIFYFKNYQSNSFFTDKTDKNINEIDLIDKNKNFLKIAEASHNVVYNYSSEIIDLNKFKSIESLFKNTNIATDVNVNVNVNVNVSGSDEMKINNIQRPLIYHFWASWCEPCINEIPELIEYSKKQQSNIVLISSDTDFESLEKFIKIFPEIKNKDLFAQVWDKEGFLSNLFKVDKLPMTIVFFSNKRTQKIDGSVDWKSFKSIN